MRLKAPTERTELVKNRRIVYNNETGIPNRFVLAWQEDGDARAGVSAEYWTVPVPAMGKLCLPIIYRMNERQSNGILANQRARVTR